MRSIFTLVAVISWSFLVAQSNQDYQVVKDSEIADFEITKGVYDHSFKLNNGERWPIKVSIPEIKKGKKYPLVIALHWAGNSRTYNEFSDCLALPGFEYLESIIIAPSSDAGRWFLPNNEFRVIDLIHKLTKYWPIEADQIIIMGYSNGAIGSWQYIQNHPNLFHTAILLAGNYSVSKIEIPVFVLHGKKDELFAFEEVERRIEESIQKGSKIEFIGLNKFSHFMACNYRNALKSVVAEIKKDL